MSRNQDEGTLGVVEGPELDEAALEQEAARAGAKIISLEDPGRGPVRRVDFLRAARTYKPKVEVVDLPAPFEGRQIKVRELTAGERDRYESSLVRGKLGKQTLRSEELRVGLIVMAAVDWDDESSPLFTEKDKEDLRKMGISVISTIYNAAAKLSAISEEDEKELEGE